MTYTAYDLSNWLGYMSHNEIDFLSELVQSLAQQPLVVNIGAGAGTSGLAIAQSRPDVVLMTVDINENSPHGCLRGERNALRKANLDLEGRHLQCLADSAEAAKLFSAGKLRFGGVADMVFIDDGHNRRDVERDIDSWLPLIMNGGIIALHDYGSNNWPDVKTVTDQRLGHLPKIGISDTLIAFRVAHDEI